MSAISGFPEWLPEQQSVLEHWKNTLAQHFQKFCFVPMETPVVERMSTLVSKGDDSEIYAVTRWADADAPTPHTVSLDRKLGLRFDLTIPLARYVTQHAGQLVFPYRRYHIAPVWRGERPQEGRFRQFYQCDIDTIGQESLPKAYDSETIFTLHTALGALGIEPILGTVHWHINHRNILTSWAEYAGIEDVSVALREIDKVDKVGLESVLTILRSLNASEAALEILVLWARSTESVHEKIQHMHQLNWSPAFTDALHDILDTANHLFSRGLRQDEVFFDPLLARGLAYYSGITFEGKLPQHKDLGSICAGGRYDHLATLLSSKKPLPGVGGSIGLSRLFARFIEHTTPVLQAGDIFIGVQESTHLAWYIQLGDILRQLGWRCEVFLGTSPLKNQMKYANRKGFAAVILANLDELSRQSVQVKIMATGQQETMPVDDLGLWLSDHLCKNGGGAQQPPNA
jgi:histidyl-tRNA synthetase